METIKGTVNRIGSSRIENNDYEKISVLEIGDHILRNILVSDYLKNYIKLGDEVEIMVYKGVISRFISAVRVNNKIYKVSPSVFRMRIILKTLLVAPLLISIPFLALKPQVGGSGLAAFVIGAFLIFLFVAYQRKGVSKLAKF